MSTEDAYERRGKATTGGLLFTCVVLAIVAILGSDRE